MIKIELKYYDIIYNSCMSKSGKRIDYEGIFYAYIKNSKIRHNLTINEIFESRYIFPSSLDFYECLKVVIGYNKILKHFSKF